MNHIRRRHGIFFSMVVSAVLLGGLAAGPAFATPAAARTQALPGSAAPRVPAGATRLGAVPASQPVHFDVALNVRDQAALTAYLDGLANRQSPYYHRFLAKGQFGPMFGPTLAQVQAVEGALKAAGLSPGAVTPDRLIIPVTATAAQADRAFGVSLINYRLPGGRVAFANATAPAIATSVAPLVLGVLGLNDLYEAQPESLARASAAPARQGGLSAGLKATAVQATVAGPQPCPAAAQAGKTTINYFADYYGISQLYSLGDLGQGQRVALLELEPDTPSNVTAYENCYGLHRATVNYDTVDGGPGNAPQSPETPLDIDVVAGLAPEATIDVYQAPNTATGIVDALDDFVDTDTDATLSTSWGACEADTGAQVLNLYGDMAEAADAQGQTVLAAAGDSGSTDCYSPASGGSDLAIDAPGSTPYVISVGGTGFGSSGEAVVWNDSGHAEGAGGGGLSGYWCMPDYQYQPSIPGLFAGETSTYSACADSVDTPGYAREAPDVAANADPETGYVVYDQGGWQVIGGTSGAAPVWAAIAALTDASPYCSAYGSGPAGVFPQALYAAVADDAASIYHGARPQVIQDITSGNNDYTPSGYTGGLYEAGTGYDLASGLGAPIVAGVSPAGASSTYYPGYTALMCKVTATRLTSDRVTSVSPDLGAAGKRATVTVHGSGFLPIAGADQLRVYSGSTVLATLTPSCSTTSCTVTLPAESARTVSLRVSVEDGGYTATVSGDRYTYESPPHVKSVSPAKGSHKGGTKVTVKGSNFAGVKSVTFGGKAGTRVTVSGTGTLTVITPKGTRGAKVKVVIAAAGGTSNTVLFLYT